MKKVEKSQVMEHSKKLYPMPHVMLKARRLVNDPHSNFSQIANVLQADPGLAGRVIKVVNSAYYRRSSEIASVQQAASLLGMRVISQIVTLVSQSRMLGQELLGYGMEAGFLWRHSLYIAVFSEYLTEKSGCETRSEAFLAGLMHDAGKVILNPWFMEQEKKYGLSIQDMGPCHWEAEKEILGFDHAEIGSELCAKWQLPALTNQAIRFHHYPALSSGNFLAHVLFLADFTAHHMDSMTEGDLVFEDIRPVLDFLKLQPGDLIEAADSVSERVETLEEDTL